MPTVEEVCEKCRKAYAKTKLKPTAGVFWMVMSKCACPVGAVAAANGYKDINDPMYPTVEKALDISAWAIDGLVDGFDGRINRKPNEFELPENRRSDYQFGIDIGLKLRQELLLNSKN